MERRRLYFLTHEGEKDVFSGYGIPLRNGDKSCLIGMLMIDRPKRCPDAYIKALEHAFGEAVIGPMTANGDRGLYTQMWISDPYSLSLVRDDIAVPYTEETKEALEFAIRWGFVPKTRLELWWSREERLWVSRFELSGP